MKTELHHYKAACYKAGVVMHVDAKNEEEAKEKIMESVGFWQERFRKDITKSDWIIIEEEIKKNEY